MVDAEGALGLDGGFRMEGDAAACELEHAEVVRAVADGEHIGGGKAEAARDVEEGGDLGYFGKEMGLPKPVEELVFSMKVGELGGPVRGNQGFHVIKLIDRRAKDVKPLADVKEELRAQLRQKEMERQTKIYLDDLRRKTLVEIRG